MGAAGAVLYIFCGRTSFLARSGFLSLIPPNRTIINMKVLQISFVIALAACTFSMVTAVPVPLGAGFEKVTREGASAEEDGIASLTNGLRKLEIKPPRRLASGGAEKAKKLWEDLTIGESTIKRGREGETGSAARTSRQRQ
jgi:hypothetical protein